MANIQNTTVFCDLIKDVDVSNLQNFSFNILTQIGTSLPIISLSFQYTNDQLTYELNIDTTFKFSIGSKIFDFKIVKINVDEYHYNIQAILNKTDFITKRRQFLNEGTVIETISKISSIAVKTSLTSNDKQVWIQNNISDRSFAKHLLSHCTLTDETDFPIYYIDNKGQFVIESYKNSIKKEVNVVFGNKPGTLAMTKLNTESIPITFFQNMSEDFGISSQQAYNNSYKSNVTSESSSRFMIDAGNCYDKYFSSLTSNFKNISNLYKTLYSIEIPYFYSVNLFDVIKVNNYGVTKNSEESIVSVKFLILRTELSYSSQQGFKTKMYFSKINDSK